MKSLKPVENNKTVSTSVKEDLKAEIELLRQLILKNQNEIDSVKAKQEEEVVAKERVNASSAHIDALSALEVNTNTIAATIGNIENAEIENLDVTNLHVANVFSVNEANVTELESDEVKSKTVTADEVTATKGTIDSLESEEVTSGKVTADSVKTNSLEVNRFDIAKVNANEGTIGDLKTSSLESNSAQFSEEEVTNSEIENGEIAFLKNADRFYFDEDEFLTIDSGSDSTAPDESFVAIPVKNTQTFKATLRHDGEDVFQVIYSNTKSTPLVQWSKQYEDALTHFYFSPKTETLYIGTYFSGQLRYGYDGEKSGNIPEVHYEHLPENKSDLYRYNVNRLHGVVLMGEGGADTVLSVQGTIEGKFVQDDGDFVNLSVYTDDAVELFSLAKSYLRSGNEKEGYTYEEAEVYGYIDNKYKYGLEKLSEENIENLREDGILIFDDSTKKLVATETLYLGEDKPFEGLDVKAGIFVANGQKLLDALIYNGWVQDSGRHYPRVGFPSVFLASNNYEYYRAEDDGVSFVNERGTNTVTIAFNSVPTTFLAYQKATTESGEVIFKPSYQLDGTTVTSVELYREVAEGKGETEALEKVKFKDEHTLVLTVDAKYGQDEITITDEEETLPFVVGFTIRTPKIDKAFNSEAKPIPNNAIVNDQVGY